MTQPSTLSDEMVRQLVAVGQVDILVGLPTLDNAATVAGVVKAVHVAFSKQFTRDRTVMIHSDGGSTDGTPEIVRDASIIDAETLTASHGLRTTHRISTPYHGIPGKAGALRTFFAAADLLQAKAVAVIEPNVTNPTPEWVAALVRPAFREQIDYVVPLHPRHRFDAPLVSQIIRPLIRGAYGCQVRQAAGGEFGCSGRFAAHCLEQDVWEGKFSEVGLDLWLATHAMASGYRLGQAWLGPRAVAESATLPGLVELFRQVVGSLFTCLELHERYWMARQGSEPLPTFGEEQAPRGPEAEVAIEPLVTAFRKGMDDLQPIMERILTPETHAALRETAAGDRLRVSNRLWARTVFDFAAAHRLAVMHRDHLLQAMVPIYLGRVASFVENCGACDAAAVDTQIDALGLEFEQARDYLIERWNPLRVR